MGDRSERKPWTEGPDQGAPPESWLLLDDDALLHRIESLEAGANEDERLLEVVGSSRHFFIRQEAAKRMRDGNRLFAFEDDRHIGQILVRHLNRREDVTYLERLSARSTHVEVRSAAQVQLARLWRRLDGPRDAGGLGGGLGAPQSPSPSPPVSSPTVPSTPVPTPAAPAPTSPAPPPAAAAARTTPASASPTPGAPAIGSEAPASPSEPITSAPIEKGGVDGSLLTWAAHFLVEPYWSHLGTQGTRDLLTRTRRELLGRHPALVYFEITPEAHVATNLDGGPRLPRDTLKGLAAWMAAFRAEAHELTPELELSSVRAATAMMADALRIAGFYTACDELERGDAR